MFPGERESVLQSQLMSVRDATQRLKYIKSIAKGKTNQYKKVTLRFFRAFDALWFLMP